MHYNHCLKHVKIPTAPCTRSTCFATPLHAAALVQHALLQPSLRKRTFTEGFVSMTHFCLMTASAPPPSQLEASPTPARHARSLQQTLGHTLTECSQHCQSNGSLGTDRATPSNSQLGTRKTCHTAGKVLDHPAAAASTSRQQIRMGVGSRGLTGLNARLRSPFDSLSYCAASLPPCTPSRPQVSVKSLPSGQ